MDRYTRLTELGWNMDLLRRGTVLVVGAGALGNEIIKNLALAGVGNVLVVDLDVIESHNLTRSVLFRASDVGRRKAEVAALAAADIEPRMNVRWFDAPFQTTLGLGALGNVDIVLGSLDNIQTRRDLNRACLLTNTPFIDGGLYFLDGDVRTFLPPFPVCFDCTLTQDERDTGWRRWSCLGILGDHGAGVGPTAPTVASMVGGLQAQLALKYLHKDFAGPYPMLVPNGVRIRFNGFADEYERWDLNRDSECPTHLSVTSVPLSPITSIPYGNDMPAAQLLEIAQAALGHEAYIELGFDVVHSLHCFQCDRIEAAARRRGALGIAETMCPECTPSVCFECGHSIAKTVATRPDLVFPEKVDCAACFESNPLVLRDSQTLNRIEPGSPALAYSLAELTVPMMDILEARDFEGQKTMYIQLDGDRDKVFGTC
ncbi:MAG TPA: ThiF family adenylyltransferase [Dehalococcoidia bacterium]|nr:ThiF family adenylyltransferase [Dehalococcoidia bacterium]